MLGACLPMHEAASGHSDSRSDDSRNRHFFPVYGFIKHGANMITTAPFPARKAFHEVRLSVVLLDVVRCSPVGKERKQEVRT